MTNIKNDHTEIKFIHAMHGYYYCYLLILFTYFCKIYICNKYLVIFRFLSNIINIIFTVGNHYSANKILKCFM